MTGPRGTDHRSLLTDDWSPLPWRMDPRRLPWYAGM